MPQLDLPIGFTQIFWLVIIFILVYSLVIHYILPLYIKALKTRKLLVEINKRECQIWNVNFCKNEEYFKNLLEHKIKLIKEFFFKEFKSLIFNKKISVTKNKHLYNIYTNFFLNNSLYKNKKVLDSISLNIKLKNKK